MHNSVSFRFVFLPYAYNWFAELILQINSSFAVDISPTSQLKNNKNKSLRPCTLVVRCSQNKGLTQYHFNMQIICILYLVLWKLKLLI